MPGIGPVARGYIHLDIKGQQIKYEYTYVSPFDKSGSELFDNEYLNKRALAIGKLYIQAGYNPEEVTADLTLKNPLPSLAENHIITDLTIKKGKEDVSLPEGEIFERADTINPEGEIFERADTTKKILGTAMQVFEDFVIAYHYPSVSAAVPEKELTEKDATTRVEPEPKAKEAKKEEAATKIQSVYRGHRVRKKAQEEKETEKKKIKTATKIQSVDKGYRGRKLPPPEKVQKTDLDNVKILKFMEQIYKIFFPEKEDNPEEIIEKLHKLLPKQHEKQSLSLCALIFSFFKSTKNSDNFQMHRKILTEFSKNTKLKDILSYCYALNIASESLS